MEYHKEKKGQYGRTFLIAQETAEGNNLQSNRDTNKLNSVKRTVRIVIPRWKTMSNQSCNGINSDAVKLFCYVYKDQQNQCLRDEKGVDEVYDMYINKYAAKLEVMHLTVYIEFRIPKYFIKLVQNCKIFFPFLVLTFCLIDCVMVDIRDINSYS